MTSAVHDFASIARKLNRMDQKAEWDAKNPKVELAMYGWPYGVAVPLAEPFDWTNVLDAWRVKI